MATTLTKVSNSDYALGYTNSEHERLIRQATLIAPITERFFCGAGICAGQRVLDLGSGLGDVSMAAARLVGPPGGVVCGEPAEGSIERAIGRGCAGGVLRLAFSSQC